MNRYGNLLERVASDLHIQKGQRETEQDYLRQVIYSAVGRMAAASLWDTLEDSSEVSVTHLKGRTRRQIQAFTALYPEWRSLLQGERFDENVASIVEEIYDVYLKAGWFYHTPYRLVPCAPCCCAVGSVRFCRGLALGQRQFVSGLGTFQLEESESDQNVTIEDMFWLSTDTLVEPWRQLTEDAQWIPLQNDANIEYLNLKPPFRGYWVSAPDKEITSLCKISTKGVPMYALYRMQSNRISYSPIPEWKLLDPVFTGNEKHTNYRLFSNSLLANLGILPSTRFCIDGEIVTLRVGYWMPPREMNLVKLYSWPASFYSPASPFRRVMDKTVFLAIKTILERIGFSFEEES